MAAELPGTDKLRAGERFSAERRGLRSGNGVVSVGPHGRARRLVPTEGIRGNIPV